MASKTKKIIGKVTLNEIYFAKPELVRLILNQGVRGVHEYVLKSDQEIFHIDEKRLNASQLGKEILGPFPENSFSDMLRPPEYVNPRSYSVKLTLKKTDRDHESSLRLLDAVLSGWLQGEKGFIVKFRNYKEATPKGMPDEFCMLFDNENAPHIKTSFSEVSLWYIEKAKIIKEDYSSTYHKYYYTLNNRFWEG